MSALLDLLSGALLFVGCAALLIGVIGVIRLPDLFTRLHAASVIDSMAVFFMFAGLALQSGFSLVTVKLVIILFFLLFTTPVAAHALAKSALHGKLRPQLADSPQNQERKKGEVPAGDPKHG